jgi:L-fuculose-phosphate aldolase
LPGGRTDSAPDPGSVAPAREIIAAGRDMVAAGAVVGTAGNVSARLRRGFLITPTRMAYDSVGAADLVALDLDGTVLQGDAEPSREWPLHAAIYRGRADVSSVVHTHSPHATAWSFLGEDLLPEIEETAYYGIGRVMTSAPAPAGSRRLASHALAALGSSRALLLYRHGVVAVGDRPADALLAALVVEHHAQIAWLLRGGARAAPASAPPSARFSERW